MSFGVLAVAAGFSVAQTCAMSLLTFTGASQFTFVSVIASGGTAAAGLPPALLLAARNGIYALSLRDVLHGGRLRRAVDAHLVIDESTAMAHAQSEHPEKRRAFLLTGLGILLCWNLGTLAGALAGGAIADPGTLGLDAIFPAVFLALLVPQIRSRRALRTSWWSVLALCACAYALKYAGVVLAARTSPDGAARGSLELVVVPVIAALVVVQTLDGGDGEIVLDPRLPALVVAAVLIWRKAPIIVIVLAAAGTAAGWPHLT